MSSSITLYDDDGNPVVVSGEAMKQGLATAWAKMGVDGEVIESFNIASIEKTTDGKYTVNFASPMDNANYSVVPSGDGGASINSDTSNTTNTINACYLTVSNVSGGFIDIVAGSLVVHGGKL